MLDDLSVDSQARSVRRGGEPVELPDLSFDALLALLEAAPHPLSVDDFARRVWRLEHVSAETVAQRIALLRKALGDDPKRPRYIRTVRGAGYAATASVARAEADTPPPSLWKVQPSRLAAAASLAIAAVAVTLGALGGERETPGAAHTGPQSETAILVHRAKQQLALHQFRETDRALALLREAVAREPENFDARLALSFALTTKATKFGGGLEEKKEAEALARALIAAEPKSSGAWSSLGYSLDAQGRSNEGLTAYRYAYRLDPTNASALSSAAYVHLIQGDLHQALMLERQAQEAGGASRYAEIQIAQALELIGHPAAEAWRARALSMNPGQVVVLSELARSHLRRGEAEAALEVLDQTRGEDRSAPIILQLRGRAALMLGRHDEARRSFEAAGAWAAWDLAALEAGTGENPPTEAWLAASTLSLEEKRMSTWSRVALAEIMAGLGREVEALDALSQAVDLGWRDIAWLKQSPYLRELMASEEGRRVVDRVRLELEAQEELIMATRSLAEFIDLPAPSLGGTL
ncbi:winged helix-turn-helix domain-containing protein [Parvularcula sp. BGMRC 0090]|uniref:Winged helix-turn-helix domain-containing protein n=2 Tax=Parvularcula maris TaxID=2965077 RepID=A0A9X2LB66_9PROT|nr:winged helix-turn-helix domain-containing protein [Parvularcula maris]